MSEQTNLCRTCYEPLGSDERPPHCASCIEYWQLIEAAIRHAKIDRSVRERLSRIVRDVA